jgi:hypothetical protein
MTSWRNEIEIHPAAELFPLMNDQDLDTLGADIKQNGLKVAVVVYIDPDGKLWFLDGRNRLDAMERVDMPFAPTGAGLDAMVKSGAAKVVRNIDPYAWIVSANIVRRHLTADQRRDLIAKLLKLEPGKTDRQIAETVNADHKTVGAVRAQAEARGEIPHVATRTDRKGRQQLAHSHASASRSSNRLSLGTPSLRPAVMCRLAPTRARPQWRSRNNDWIVCASKTSVRTTTHHRHCPLLHHPTRRRLRGCWPRSTRRSRCSGS